MTTWARRQREQRQAAERNQVEAEALHDWLDQRELEHEPEPSEWDERTDTERREDQ